MHVTLQVLQVLHILTTLLQEAIVGEKTHTTLMWRCKINIRKQVEMLKHVINTKIANNNKTYKILHANHVMRCILLNDNNMKNKVIVCLLTNTTIVSFHTNKITIKSNNAMPMTIIVTNHIRNKPDINHMMNRKTTQVTMGIPTIMTDAANDKSTSSSSTRPT
jgi:hypothetical protein